MKIKFKSLHSFEDRITESNLVLNKFPNRLPIICERSHNCKK